jgi:hypothetical protein
VTRVEDDLDRQIDELLDRIRVLVADRGVLEAGGAGDVGLWANRQAILRSRQRLAQLVEEHLRRSAPPAA